MVRGNSRTVVTTAAAAAFLAAAGNGNARARIRAAGARFWTLGTAVPAQAAGIPPAAWSAWLARAKRAIGTSTGSVCGTSAGSVCGTSAGSVCGTSAGGAVAPRTGRVSSVRRAARTSRADRRQVSPRRRILLVAVRPVRPGRAAGRRELLLGHGAPPVSGYGT
jgi:hypothetical protein